jgi:hypothetical protein
MLHHLSRLSLPFSIKAVSREGVRGGRLFQMALSPAFFRILSPFPSRPVIPIHFDETNNTASSSYKSVTAKCNTAKKQEALPLAGGLQFVRT